MRAITYRGGYKYQLREPYMIPIEIKPATPVGNDYLRLDCDGNLTVSKGYAWDGPSGPTLDTLSFMRGSLVHDALYQLMREGLIDHEAHRGTADRILYRLCLEDGMWRPWAWWVYQAVRRFADPAADPAAARPALTAPRGEGG